MNSSDMPSEKYSLAGSPVELTIGSTAIDFSGMTRALRSMGREIICCAGRKDRHEAQARRSTRHCCAAPARHALACLLKFLRERGVAERLGVEIDQMKPDAVLDLALTQVAQPRTPIAGNAPDHPPRAGREECVRRRRNPSPVAPC